MSEERVAIMSSKYHRSYLTAAARCTGCPTDCTGSATKCTGSLTKFPGSPTTHRVPY